MGKLGIIALVAVGAAFASSSAQAMPMRAGGQAVYDRLCGDHGESAQHAKFVDWLTSRLELNDAQKASFKDFQDTREKSIADTKTAVCTSKPDLAAFEGRLAFHQAILEARLDAVKAEDPKLIAFYNSLNDQQKKTFDEIREHSHR